MNRKVASPLKALATWLSMTVMRAAQGAINALTPATGYIRHGDIRYGETPRHALDVYVPVDTAAGAALPVVVFFYGGGWREGDRRGYRFVAQALASQGYVVVIPDYRLYPQVRFPAFVHDGAAAVAWVHRHIGGYGGDPETLFVMGHSAGAHIAALLALDARYLQWHGGGPAWVSGMVGMAGPYDFLPFRGDFYRVVFEPETQFPDSQPIHFANAQAPPLLLLHGLNDKVVGAKNARNLAAAVDGAGGQVRTVLYPKQSHVSILAGLAWPLRRLGSMRADVTDFLDERARARRSVEAADGGV